MGGEFQRELNKTTGLDQITDLRRSITEPIRQTASEMAREFNKITEAGTVEPSGAIAPKNPAAESVVAEIHEKTGMSPATAGVLSPPVMTGAKVVTATVAAPAAASIASPPAVESPAPVEMAVPVRRPRARKAAPAATPEAVKPTPKPRARKAAAAESPAPAEAKPPRARRTPKAEA
jgi:sec-independent protein translocase protein TatB